MSNMRGMSKMSAFIYIKYLYISLSSLSSHSSHSSYSTVRSVEVMSQIYVEVWAQFAPTKDGKWSMKTRKRRRLLKSTAINGDE